MRRLSRAVEGVRFSFSVPTWGWTPGPIKRLPDESGFRRGRLYISKDTAGPQNAEAVVFWTSFPDGHRADPCANLLNPPVGPSAAALAAAVATAPGTELVTGPSDVTVGGRAAKHVVLTVREDVGCDPGYFYTWQDEMRGPFWVGTEAGHTIRVWIVDVAGTRLFIEAETTGQAGSELEQEIQQIVESIRFENDLTRAEWILRAAAICGEASTKFHAAEAELDPPNSGPWELEAQAAWSKAAIRFSEQALAELRVLPPPEGDRAWVKEILSLFEQPIDVLRKVPAAAAAGNTPRVETLMGERVRLTHLKDGAVGLELFDCPVSLPA